jgi:hypothetical protein
MESTGQQTAAGSGENEPILHLNRSLIPLEEYAAREGVSVSIIYECDRMGIVQIRKYRGRSYVVDVPLSPHMAKLETKDGFGDHDDTVPASKSLSEKIKEFSAPEDLSVRQAELDEIARDKFDSNTVETWNSPAHDYSDGFLDEYILEQIESNETFKREVGLELPGSQEGLEQPESPEGINDDEIIEMLELEALEPAKNTDDEEQISDPATDTMSDEPIRIPDLEILPQPSGVVRQMDKTDAEQVLQKAITTEEEHRPLETKSVIQTRRFWQVMTSFALLLFITAVCVTVWIYSDYQVQQGRLDEAYASIQSVYNDFIEQKETSNTLQGELDEAQANLLQLQNELGQSNAQIRTLKIQLGQVSQGTESKQLKDQVQDLAGQINDIAGN